MPFSKLTDGFDELVDGVIATLEGAGYSWNTNTQSFAQYLATALSGIGGTPVSYLQLSVPELLTGLANALGDTLFSHLSSSIEDLLVAISNGESGPPPDDEWEELDGRNDAPAGAANYPTLLDSFGSNRPPWQVAGVDYRVGVPQGLTLKAASGIEADFPGGAIEISGSIVNLNNSNLVVDGYDFTGYFVRSLGNNNTIQNCYTDVGFGTYHTDDVWNLGQKLTVRYCTIVGPEGVSGNLGFNGNHLIVEYCLFDGAESDHIQLSGGFYNNTSMIFICRFNHFRNTGFGEGAHGDVIQTFPNGSAAYAEWTVTFNSTGPQSNTQGFMYEPDNVTPGNGAKLTGAGEIGYNTFTGGMNFYVGATLLDVGTATGGTFSVHDNYYDAESVDGFARPSQCSPGDADAATTYTGNIDMNTGSPGVGAND